MRIRPICLSDFCWCPAEGSQLGTFYAINWLISANFDSNFIIPEINVNQMIKGSAYLLGPITGQMIDLLVEWQPVAGQGLAISSKMLPAPPLMLMPLLFELNSSIVVKSIRISDVQIRASRIRTRIQAPRIRIQRNPNPPLFSWIQIRIQLLWIRIWIQIQLAWLARIEKSKKVGVWSEPEMSNLDSNPNPPFFFLESKSGFWLSSSESESECESSPKSSESGFESESGFGFAHHWLEYH